MFIGVERKISRKKKERGREREREREREKRCHCKYKIKSLSQTVHQKREDLSKICCPNTNVD